MSAYLYTDTGNLPEGFEDPAQKLRGGRFSKEMSEREYVHSFRNWPTTIQDAEAQMNIIRQNPKALNYENTI